MRFFRLIADKLKNNSTRRSRVALLVAALAIGLGLLLPRFVQAVGFLSTITTEAGFTTFLVNTLFYPIVQFLGNALVVIINILIAVAQYNDFINATAVAKGWVIMRDLCNMFFIIILLVIAFGTILKLEQYRYNRLLGKLIIYAFLINFSKFIAGLWIDIGQVIMLTFVNGFKDAAAGNFASGLGMANMLSLAKNPSVGDVDSSNIFGAMLLAIALLVIALIVIVIMTIILLLRILTLWILIVLSPIAFITRIFPNTAKYSDQWWGEFNKQIIVGPVMAFFIWLALTIVAVNGADSANYGFKEVSRDEQSALIGDMNGRGAGTAKNIAASITEISQSDKLLSYMITIGLLLGSLQAAQQIGVAGSKIAGDWSQKIRTGGLTAAGVLSGVAGARLAMRATKGGAQLIGGKVSRWATMKKVGGNFQPGMYFTKKYWEGVGQHGKETQAESDSFIMAKGQQTRKAFEYKFMRQLPDAMPAVFENAQVADIYAAAAEAEKQQGRNPSTEKRLRGLSTAARRGKGGGLKEVKEAIGNLLATYKAGNGDDDIATLLTSGELTEGNAKEEWGADYDDQVSKGFAEEQNDVTMLHRLDLNRQKYSPIAIAHRMAMEKDASGALQKKVWEAYFSSDDAVQKAAMDDKDVFKIIEDSRAERDAATIKADDYDMLKLRGLQETSEQARLIGHDEQTRAKYDEKIGRAKVMDPIEQQEYVLSQIDKMQPQEIANLMTPHGLAHYKHDAETNEIYAEIDPTKQSRLGTKKFKALQQFQDRDGSRIPDRYPERALGVRGSKMVRDQDAFFDENGAQIESPAAKAMYVAALKARGTKAMRYAYWKKFKSAKDSLSTKLPTEPGFVDQVKAAKMKNPEFDIANQEAAEKTDDEKGAWHKETRTNKVDGKDQEEEWEVRDMVNEKGDVEKQERRVLTEEQKTHRTEDMQEAELDTIDLRKTTANYSANLPHMDAESIGHAFDELTASMDKVAKRIEAVSTGIQHPGARSDLQQLAKDLKQQKSAPGDRMNFIGTKRDDQLAYFMRSEQILRDIEKTLRRSTKAPKSVTPDNTSGKSEAGESGGAEPKTNKENKS